MKMRLCALTHALFRPIITLKKIISPLKYSPFQSGLKKRKHVDTVARDVF